MGGNRRAWRTLFEIPKSILRFVPGDFIHPDPVRTFSLDYVAFVCGSRYKQRYFTKRGNDYFPLPAQWDIAKKRWLPYHVEAGTEPGSEHVAHPTRQNVINPQTLDFVRANDACIQCQRGLLEGG
jgi:hypothetical protein